MAAACDFTRATFAMPSSSANCSRPIVSTVSCILPPRAMLTGPSSVRSRFCGPISKVPMCWSRQRAGHGRARAAHRFIHVSTDEVFGDLAPDDPPFTEKTPYRPSSPYAASKASADHLVRAWQRTHGLPAIVINSGNNYGPWQFPEKLIPLIILNAIEGAQLPVYGDGQQVRDWLHVSDHCRAIRSVIENGKSAGPILSEARTHEPISMWCGAFVGRRRRTRACARHVGKAHPAR